MEILAQPLCETVFTPTTFRHTKRLPIRISRPSHKKFHFKNSTDVFSSNSTAASVRILVSASSIMRVDTSSTLINTLAYILSVDIKTWDKRHNCIKSKIRNIHWVNLAFYKQGYKNYDILSETPS
jgi:hypothetical protein